MPVADAKCKAALGFLTVIEHPEQGLFGGYLVLNLAGRPLEFHCTAPIRPNRAQQILYGPTLEPFLFGEQIGCALLERSSAAPLAVCTDREPVLAVRDFVEVPVAWVLPEEDVETEVGGNGSVRIDRAHGPAAPAVFRLGRNRLAVARTAAGDRDLLLSRLGPAAESFDLAEPFGRIREAIEEARRGGPSG